MQSARGYLPGMLGEELRRAREQVGLTPQRLSVQVGVHRTSISQLERDQKPPMLEVLFHLCDAMGLSAA
jgi:transcriptional regulator with XRE-family HTH domain